MAQCGERCALEGASYPKAGVTTTNISSSDSDSVTLHIYHKYWDRFVAVGPQIYLLSADRKNYQLLYLLNREISFTVNVSNLPCGMNGGMYLAEMSPTGGRSHLDSAGAAYGTGYCDSQCYTSYAFVDGKANVDGKIGACCGEMDIWEANSRSTQTTAHPCTADGFYGCKGKKCGGGKQGVCDGDGCGFNPYGLGDHSFYGLGGKVDTKRPLRVVTKFVTHDGTDEGKLIEIRRHYLQDSRTIANAEVTLQHRHYDSITENFCKVTDATSFQQRG